MKNYIIVLKSKGQILFQYKLRRYSEVDLSDNIYYTDDMGMIVKLGYLTVNVSSLKGVNYFIL